MEKNFWGLLNQHKWVAAVVIFFIAAGLVSHFVFQFILTPLLVKEMGRAFQVPVSIESSGINLIRGSLWMKNIRIRNPRGFASPDFLTARQLYIDISTLGLIANRLLVNQIRLDDPMIFFEENTKKEWNVIRLEQNVSDSLEKFLKRRGKFFSWFARYEIGKFAIRNGGIHSMSQLMRSEKWTFQPVSFSLARIIYPSDPEEALPAAIYINALIRGARTGQLLLLGRFHPFAPKKSFDLTGSFKDIVLSEYDIFFPAFPLDFIDGTLTLKYKAICHENLLEMNFQASVRQLKFQTRPVSNGGTKILAFGIPAEAITSFFNGLRPGTNGFDFNFQVNGDLENPDFDVFREVTEKLQIEIQSRMEEKMREVQGELGYSAEASVVQKNQIKGRK